MATDNPRAVDDQTLAPKDRLNGVVFYISALIILIFLLPPFCLMTLLIMP
jgi:choline/glycine/proline betaine transport protein